MYVLEMLEILNFRKFIRKNMDGITTNKLQDFSLGRQAVRAITPSAIANSLFFKIFDLWKIQ